MLLVLYLISFLDRANIGNGLAPSRISAELMIAAGNAKIEGLLESLDMNGSQYNVALAIYFVPYVLAGTTQRLIPLPLVLCLIHRLRSPE
jgi:hypothetical protein